jgi:hypothetical protein
LAAAFGFEPREGTRLISHGNTELIDGALLELRS